ncbi:MAG: phage tail sheath family protein [Methanothrix sp.]|nr:MAG: phage tail sheath family protein [Methanothrix sp.]
MPQYLTPGVYVEEIEIGAKPIEGVSTNVAGFLGETERGPEEPTFITNFDQFKRLYGGYIAGSYLAYAIDGYFRNGGGSCFVARIANKDSKYAALILKNAASNPENSPEKNEDANIDADSVDPIEVAKIQAIGPGLWGISVQIGIKDAGLSSENANLFKLEIYNEKGLVEVYDNLSPSDTSSDYYEKRVNGISNLVTISHLKDGRPVNIANTKMIDGSDAAVTAEDYKGRVDEKTGKLSGLMAFSKISEISLICAPDENKFKLSDLLKEHCEKHKDRFAILQAGELKKNITELSPPVRSKYAAYYYPWIKVLDPVTNMPKYVPPCGHLAGVYSRTDVERGVHKAPANTPVSGALDLQFSIVDAEQEILNPRGVNCIRSFPGKGILVWGARTTSLDSSWKYINVSRLFIFVEKSIKEGIRWAVFEPNNEKLWSRVKQTVDQFLTAVWRTGALMGTTADQAFFVRCDRTTMTQDDIDSGRLVVLVGIAPTKPAEFVILRIAQVAKGADISEA